MGLYEFQEDVFDAISAGQSVILQAPTGSGKTRAALYPFLQAWEYEMDFPRKCIYSVPLRVLANQFQQEYNERAKNFGFLSNPHVSIHTGAQPLDPKVEADLAFTTIDQTLSNFLNIPYSLGKGQANLNAGALFSSYLVFDELHLLDPETTLPTTLHLLQLLKGIVPFLVMTATLSEEMVRALAKQLGAKPIVLSADEAAAIPSQNKVRRIHWQEQTLSPEQVLETHQDRSIAICNTVDRAQTLYAALQQIAGSNIEVRLLHSRFYQEDRLTTEEWLKREFGKEKEQYTVESAIFIATQVIEVGVDITSRALHTELAPAASIIQRAGRCARYEHEEGDVFVYALPVDDSGNPLYAPYQESIQRRICELTQAYLQTHSGDTFDFGAELALVNDAHQDADQRLLAELQSQRSYIRDQIVKTIQFQDRGAAATLIRNVDNRTVIAHPDPKRIENPWELEGIGIFQGSLFRIYDTLEDLRTELDLEWALMTADPVPEVEGTRTRTIWKWRSLHNKDDLVGALLLAVNPLLVRYSNQTGFQLGVPSEQSWQSPMRKRVKPRRSFAPYQRETIQEHVQRMLRVYQYGFYDRTLGKQRQALNQEMAYAWQRVEEKFGWPRGTLDQAIRMVIALHDLGKLDIRWQKWAHDWQKQVSQIRGEDLIIADDYLAAHTDYDSMNEEEKKVNQKMRSRRPNHAAESAAAAIELLKELKDPALVCAALTAIVRHHTADASGGHGPFQAHLQSRRAVLEIFTNAGLETYQIERILWNCSSSEALNRRLINFDDEKQLLVYLFLSRVLRMADQRSQELY